MLSSSLRQLFQCQSLKHALPLNDKHHDACGRALTMLQLPELPLQQFTRVKMLPICSLPRLLFQHTGWTVCSLSITGPTTSPARLGVFESLKHDSGPSDTSLI